MFKDLTCLFLQYILFLEASYYDIYWMIIKLIKSYVKWRMSTRANW